MFPKGMIKDCLENGIGLWDGIFDLICTLKICSSTRVCILITPHCVVYFVGEVIAATKTCSLKKLPFVSQSQPVLKF
jgi:hypothetical protein